MVAILVVLTLLVCISIDAVLQKRRANVYRATRAAPIPTQAAHLPFQTQLPKYTYLHPGHTWMRLMKNRSHTVRVGIGAFIAYLAGKVDRIHLPPVGTHIHQGEQLLTIEQKGRTLDLLTPVSGVIASHNPRLDESLNMPSDDGNWVCDMRPTQLAEERRNLLSAAAARAWLESELKRFGEWLTQQYAPEPGLAMQDGGLPVTGALMHLNNAEWAAFQTQFLSK